MEAWSNDLNFYQNIFVAPETVQGNPNSFQLYRPRPFICTVCMRGFESRRSLGSHKKVHKPKKHGRNVVDQTIVNGARLHYGHSRPSPSPSSSSSMSFANHPNREDASTSNGARLHYGHSRPSPSSSPSSSSSLYFTNHPNREDASTSSLISPSPSTLHEGLLMSFQNMSLGPRTESMIRNPYTYQTASSSSPFPYHSSWANMPTPIFTSPLLSAPYGGLALQNFQFGTSGNGLGVSLGVNSYPKPNASILRRGDNVNYQWVGSVKSEGHNYPGQLNLNPTMGVGNPTSEELDLDLKL